MTWSVQTVAGLNGRSATIGSDTIAPVLDGYLAAQALGLPISLASVQAFNPPAVFAPGRRPIISPTGAFS